MADFIDQGEGGQEDTQFVLNKIFGPTYSIVGRSSKRSTGKGLYLIHVLYSSEENMPKTYEKVKVKEVGFADGTKALK